VWITGVNWFGYETSQMEFHGLWNRDLKGLLDQVVDDFGFNALRVPIHIAQILGWKNGGGGYPINVMIQGDINPYLEGKTSLQILDVAIDYCKQIGLKVIFDIHSLVPDGYTYNLWYDSSYSLNDLIESWRFIAGRYNDDVIIGLDHEVTLGANGTNITRYYGGTTNAPATEPTQAATDEPATTPTNSAAGLTGDVNSNGVVDIIDALLVAQYYVGLDPANFTTDNADASCNGTIDIVDALLIAQYYVGLISGFDC
jgi:aryl-phospho-beta-D-glucosidase BglC (GH1 family)